MALLCTTVLTPRAGATGAELARRWNERTSVAWSNAPLRDSLSEMARAKGIGILLDRRIDPGQEFSLSANQTPLGEVLGQIAADRGLGLSRFGPVAYFGPPEVAARLRTLAAMRKEDARRLPTEAASRLVAKKVLQWPDFATPRELLEEAVEEAGLRLVGLERVPHDLWAAAELPPLSLVDRLTLLAVQFNLTFDIAPDGSAIRLTPIRGAVAVVRDYPGGQSPEATARRFTAMAPEAQVKVVGDRVYVKGLVEQHERLLARPSAQPSPRHEKPSSGSSPKYTRIDHLTITEVPLGRILPQVARQLGLTLRIDQAALKARGISLDRRISLEVKNITIDELFEALTRPVGLSFRREGTIVEIP